MELKIKGTSQVSFRKLVQKQGENVEQAFLEKLTPEQKKNYNALAVSWIPLETDPTSNALAIFAHMLFPNDPLAIQKVGQELAKIAMPTFYQIFLRIPTVDFVFKRVASVWKSYYQKGDFTRERVNDKEMSLSLSDFPDYPKHLLDFVSGFLLGMGEIVGLKNMKIRKKIDDPMHWKWIMTWD